MHTLPTNTSPASVSMNSAVTVQGLREHICPLLRCYLMGGSGSNCVFHDNTASKSLFSYRPAFAQNGWSGKKYIILILIIPLNQKPKAAISRHEEHERKHLLRGTGPIGTHTAQGSRSGILLVRHIISLRLKSKGKEDHLNIFSATVQYIGK